MNSKKLARGARWTCVKGQSLWTWLTLPGVEKEGEQYVHSYTKLWPVLLHQPEKSRGIKGMCNRMYRQWYYSLDSTEKLRDRSIALLNQQSTITNPKGHNFVLIRSDNIFFKYKTWLKDCLGGWQVLLNVTLRCVTWLAVWLGCFTPLFCGGGGGGEWGGGEGGGGRNLQTLMPMTKFLSAFVTEFAQAHRV